MGVNGVSRHTVVCFSGLSIDNICIKSIRNVENYVIRFINSFTHIILTVSLEQQFYSKANSHSRLFKIFLIFIEPIGLLPG